MRRCAYGLVMFTLGACLAGCGGGGDLSTSGGRADQATTAPFPDGFVFGSAIAGFQVEMGCPSESPETCEDRNSDWYAWITQPLLRLNPLLFLSGDPPSAGPGFHELYRQDLDLAANDLGNNSLRLSLEWSRIFPTSTVGIEGFEALRSAASPDALAFYHAVLQEMRQRGLRPNVTINHYTLPTWIHDGYGCHFDLAGCKARGWLGGEVMLHEIEKYAGFVAREFGGEVDTWATLNEPFSAVILPSYLVQTAARTNPPGVFMEITAAKQATRTMIEAHARMYDAVHTADTVDADGDGQPARVGLVYAMAAISPLTDNSGDAEAAKNMDYFINRMFLNGVIRGDLDVEWDGVVEHHDELAGRMDFLGINYYFSYKAQNTIVPLVAPISPLITFNLLDMHEDDNDPGGIYRVLGEAKEYGVPLLISETGVSDPGDDGSGPAWVVKTTSWVRRAIAEGAPVEGYYYWSLMDNYEWNHGTQMRFGLYDVEPTDPQKQRRARRAAGVYAQIAKAGAIPAELAAAYPIE